ncbi:MAG: nucleoside hydrolase [Gemmatimonadales bacterium]|nr:nucleoside hydrolase [Gemmatimonadales bacterium]
MSVPVVIDTDPGIDDALALILAARWSRADLRAVSVTYGNTTLDLAARNARIVLARAPAETLVLPGWDRPLTRPLVTAKETHGADGLGDHAAPPPDPVHPSGSALRDALRAAREPVVLVTLGPLTNLALALRLDADFVRARVVRHVAMGGNIAAASNTGPHSEFNVWCDPEAAREVFTAGLGTVMVGLDVTRRLVIPAAAVAKLATHPDEDARWFGRLLGFYVRFHQDVEGLHGAVINDPLAVALALEPSWGRAEPIPVGVDLSEGPERGRTTIGDLDAGDPRIMVYRDFDARRVRELLLEHLFGRWLTDADFAP